MNIRPHYAWVLVRPEPRKESVGGIYIPLQTGAERVGYSVGVVVKCPPELWPKSFEAEQPTAAPFVGGDRVLYRDFLKEMHEIDIEGVRHCFLHWEDIIAVVDADAELTLGGAV